MDVTSLYTSIPQEAGMNTVCIAYEKFYGEKPPIPSQHLREVLRRILKEIFFKFNGKNYLQTHGTAMTWEQKWHLPCKYLYVCDRDTPYKSKPHQTTSVEKIYWRCLLSVGHKQRGNRFIHWTGKQPSPDHKIHGWYLRNRNHFPGYMYIQGRQI